MDGLSVEVQRGVLPILGRHEVMPGAVTRLADRTSGIEGCPTHPVAQRGGIAEPQDPALVARPGVVAHQHVARAPAEPALHGAAIPEGVPIREELATAAV